MFFQDSWTIFYHLTGVRIWEVHFFVCLTFLWLCFFGNLLTSMLVRSIPKVQSIFSIFEELREVCEIFCYFQDSWTIFYRLPLQELIEGVLCSNNGLQHKHQSLQGQFFALSFYRSQNGFCRSKFFEPAKKFDCI